MSADAVRLRHRLLQSRETETGQLASATLTLPWLAADLVKINLTTRDGTLTASRAMFVACKQWTHLVIVAA